MLNTGNSLSFHCAIVGTSFKINICSVSVTVEYVSAAHDAIKHNLFLSDNKYTISTYFFLLGPTFLKHIIPASADIFLTYYAQIFARLTLRNTIPLSSSTFSSESEKGAVRHDLYLDHVLCISTPSR